ncbi:MAG: hypothetical protein PVJ42_00200 [bacterium]|jgi:cytochrome c
MKRLMIVALLAVVAVAILAHGQEKEELKAEMDPATELAKSVERGFALFNDKKLGTNGSTCNDCHKGGGTQNAKMGDMDMKAFDNLAAKYPRYFKMADKVMTLDQVVNFCVTNPLEAEPLAWDDQRLTDLVAYCASVKAPKVEKK